MIQSLANQATSINKAQQFGDRSIAVLKKAQDQQKADGKAAVSLIESAGKVSQGAPTGDHTGKLVNLKV